MISHQMRYFQVLLVCYLCVGFTVAAQAKEKELIFAYEMKPNPPYYLGEGAKTDDQLPGVTLEVLSLVAKRLGFKVRYKRMPWAWGLKSLKHGKVDGLFHASFKAKRMMIGAYPMHQGEIDPERSIMSQRYIFYKNKASPVLFNGTGFEHLKGKVGVIIGYSITEDLKKMGVETYDNSHINSSMNMLLKNRLEGVVDLENMGDAFLRNQATKFAQIIKTSPPIVQKPYYLMLSHNLVENDPELAEKIWDSIASIKESDEYVSIVKRYDHLIRQ